MVVFTANQLTSVRLLPSWALLAFAAGAVNVGAFLACQRFVAHVTGNLTMMGANLNELALDSVAVLLCFIVGATSAIVLVRRFGIGDRFLPYWIPLMLVSLVLGVVALLGRLGFFGDFGGTVETPHDLALLCMLSFSMGMQNAAVASSTDNAVRTTHMTGPATDFAVAAATLLVGKQEERGRAWRSALLRGTKLASFVLGAIMMVPLCRQIGFLAFLVPAVACTIATLTNYAPRRIAARMAEGARG
jgi:uncharacterized membrane protein YoaK (UPF0700 family)